MKQKIIDHLGRIVIPKVYRTQMGFTEGTPIHFHLDENQGVLILKKAKNVCLKCCCEDHLIFIKDGIYLCSDCLRSLKGEESMGIGPKKDV